MVVHFEVENPSPLFQILNYVTENYHNSVFEKEEKDFQLQNGQPCDERIS
jgi:hypothetical protein